MGKLHDACRQGDVEQVKSLLKGGWFSKKKNVNERDTAGRTPLHYASANGHENVVEFLLQREAQANLADSSGQIPLHVASVQGHSDIVSLLLSKNANPNARDSAGRTPLHVAKTTLIVQSLVSHGAIVNQPTDRGHTPLHFACANNRATVPLLVELKADAAAADADGQTPLDIARKEGCKDAVVVLLRKLYPLHAAAHEGKGEEMMALLSSGEYDINSIDDWGETPLHHAAKQGHDVIVNVLRVQGAELQTADKEGWTPLHHAVANKQLAVVGLLLDMGATPDTPDNHGKTPLQLAMEMGLDVFAESLEEAAPKAKDTAGADGADGADGAEEHAAAQQEQTTRNGSGAAAEHVNDSETANQLGLAPEFRTWLKSVGLLRQVGPALEAVGVEDFEALHVCKEHGKEFRQQLMDNGAKFGHIIKLLKHFELLFDNKR